MIMDKIALVLAIIGGLNWGSIGIFGFDVVAFLFGGANSAISRVIYTLVGLAAIWFFHPPWRNRIRNDDARTTQSANMASHTPRRPRFSPQEAPSR